MTDEARATPSAQPVLFGRYRVSEQLGETRFTVVYAAADERLQRRVLLHLLRKDLVGQERPRARFLAEIGQMARRSHQALLEVFDSGEAGGRPFMVTEHCAGRPLRGLGLLTVEQALLYLRQVAGAVAACQAQRGPDAPIGLYHPPISSSNVLLVDEGRVKLVDSWLSPPADAPADQAHYRAPELSEGLPPTPATAVYALGILLYELIIGERPVSGPDARATALAHLNAHIPPLRQARPGLFLPTAEGLVARATARAPERRYADAQAFGVALDTLWRDLGSATQPLAVAPGRAPTLGAPAPEHSPGPPDTTPAPGLQKIGPQATPAARAPAPRRGSAGAPAGRAVDPDLLRRRGLARGLVGWLVMVGLVITVAAASYLAVRALASGVAGLPRPAPPGLPSLPDSGGPFGWFGDLFGGDEEIYIVNIAEGLNLRREPDATDTANVITVVPNGAPVRKLDGPRVEGNIPWLLVRAEVDGREVEGWMSLNYLRPKG
jgi:hypothetical protein